MSDELLEYRRALWTIAHTPLTENECVELARDTLDRWDRPVYDPNYIDPHLDLVGIPTPEKEK